MDNFLRGKHQKWALLINPESNSKFESNFFTAKLWEGKVNRDENVCNRLCSTGS